MTFEIYQPNIQISEIQESVFHKDFFIMFKEMKYVKYAEITKKNVIKYQKHIDKKIAHFCEVSNKYVAYIHKFILYVDKLFTNNFRKADPKEIEIPNNQKSKIISMNMIYKENKLLILLSNEDDQYLKMQCIVINNICSNNPMELTKTITIVPFKISKY